MNNRVKITKLIEILTIKRNSEKSLNQWFILGNIIIKLKNTLVSMSME